MVLGTGISTNTQEENGFITAKDPVEEYRQAVYERDKVFVLFSSSRQEWDRGICRANWEDKKILVEVARNNLPKSLRTS